MGKFLIRSDDWTPGQVDCLLPEADSYLAASITNIVRLYTLAGLAWGCRIIALPGSARESEHEGALDDY